MRLIDDRALFPINNKIPAQSKSAFRINSYVLISAFLVRKLILDWEHGGLDRL
jgi:hypothetical protein